MSKKIISAVLAVLMMSSTAALAASAAEVEAEKSTGATGTFKFDMGDWNHDDDVSFYIWAKSADGSDTKWGSKSGWVDSNNWGSKKTFGTKVDGEDGIVESYEIEFLDGYDTFCIMYDPTTGVQTYNCIITENALNDTARMTGESVENPEDSEKTAIVVAFDNAADCGPQLVVTSTGNIVGTTLAPNENGAITLAKFVYNGLNADGTSAKDKSEVDKVTEEKIANAISAYGTDADTVWAEFQNLKGQEGFEEYDAKEKAAKKFINPSSAGDDDSSSEAEATDSDKDDDSSSSSSAGSTTTTTGTATTKSSTAAATTTAASTAASTSSTASAEAGAATGDTTGTSAFAVVLVAAAATMILARKKVEE